MNILLKSLTITLSLIAGLPAMENKNTNLGNCALEFTSKILTEVVKDEYVNKDFTNFQESACLLKSVCSDWCQIIDRDFLHKAMVLGCQQMCPEFLNGKLIYRPNKESDEGMVVFNISDLWNPLGGRFDLSKCGDTAQYLCISTGYRKEKKAENEKKVEIWFTPWFLVEKEPNSTASHLYGIFLIPWSEDTSVGVSWTWGNWENLEWCDYHLTSAGMDNLYINLSEKWQSSLWYPPRRDLFSMAPRRMYPTIVSRFVYELK